MSSDSDSDYIVEEFLKPTKVTAPLRNDENGDLLGNFDESNLKFKNQNDDSEAEDEENSQNEEDSEEEKEIVYDKIQIHDVSEDEEMNEETNLNSTEEPKKFSMTDEQLNKLRAGTSKTNRFVLYVTNLSSETTKKSLWELFSQSGVVKSIRIPKNRLLSIYAFVEMQDAESFKNAFNLHNTVIDGKQIKIQISEGGKKKSANKKNIMKQKNRCLAEMRNESKFFLKSGKTFGNTKTAKNRAWMRAKEKRK